MKSLRRRLNRGLALILIIVFVTHVVVASIAISYVAEKQMSTRLEHDGDSMLASLILDDAGRLQLTGDHLPLVYEQAFSGHYFVIKADGGQALRSRSLLAETLEARLAPPGQHLRYHADGP